MIYIGKTLDTHRWRLDNGQIDWAAWFAAKARGKFPNRPATLRPDEGPAIDNHARPVNASPENPAPSAPSETHKKSDLTK